MSQLYLIDYDDVVGTNGGNEKEEDDDGEYYCGHDWEI